MLLAIDIGNTNITLGLWDGRKWLEQWRLRTVHEKTVDEYWISVRTLLKERELRGAISRVIYASVVPSLTTLFGDLCRQYLHLEAIRVTHETDTGIAVLTDNPSEVGADRIVNAAAASALYGGHSIVIDMGTATTFDLVSADAELLGVVIAPGMRTAADALASRAAQLSRVALEAPPTVLGKNTIHSVQSGLVYGYVGLIEGIVCRLAAEYRASANLSTDEQISVIGTGGLITIIEPLTTIIDHVDPWLTLNGLRVISDRAGV